MANINVLEKENNNIINVNNNVENMIYEIRGVQVMYHQMLQKFIK